MAKQKYDGHVPWPGVLRSKFEETLEELSRRRVRDARKPGPTPEEQVRKAVMAACPQGTKLPPTRSLMLYYIAAVDGTAVAYLPTFLYVLDVGLPRLAAAALPYVLSGLGDPTFPDFTSAAIFSAKSTDRLDLLFPAAANVLLIEFSTATTLAEAKRALAPYGTVDEFRPSGNAFRLTITLRVFDESNVAAEIKAAVRNVRFAEPDTLMRIIDFQPGWHLVQLM